MMIREMEGLDLASCQPTSKKKTFSVKSDYHKLSAVKSPVMFVMTASTAE